MSLMSFLSLQPLPSVVSRPAPVPVGRGRGVQQPGPRMKVPPSAASGGPSYRLPPPLSSRPPPNPVPEGRLRPSGQQPPYTYTSLMSPGRRTTLMSPSDFLNYGLTMRPTLENPSSVPSQMSPRVSSPSMGATMHSPPVPQRSIPGETGSTTSSATGGVAPHQPPPVPQSASQDYQRVPYPSFGHEKMRQFHPKTLRAVASYEHPKRLLESRIVPFTVDTFKKVIWLPAPLVDELHEWLLQDPRDWLDDTWIRCSQHMGYNYQYKKFTPGDGFRTFIRLLLRGERGLDELMVGRCNESSCRIHHTVYDKHWCQSLQMSYGPLVPLPKI